RRPQHAVESKVCTKPIAVVISERIRAPGFDCLDRDTGRELAVVEILITRNTKRAVIRRVEHLPGQIRRVIPHPRTAGERTDVRTCECVQPSAQLPLGMMKRKPRGLCRPPVVTELREMK